MKEVFIDSVLTGMYGVLTDVQMSALQSVLSIAVRDFEIKPTECALSTDLANNQRLLYTYLMCLKINNASDDTIRTYKYNLNIFRSWLQDASFISIDTNTIRLFLLDCEVQGLDPVTVDHKRRILKTFYQWLADEGYMLNNIVSKIPKIKSHQKVKTFYSDMEMESALLMCQDDRERALLSFLMSTGLRASELIQVKHRDVDWNTGKLIINGKGDKERVVWLNERAIDNCLTYLYLRGQLWQQSDYLFCSVREPYDKLSDKHVNNIIHEIGSRVGIPDMHIHGIRAWFATWLSRRNVKPQTIQLLMGHSNFQTTLSYYIQPDYESARLAVCYQ